LINSLEKNSIDLYFSYFQCLSKDKLEYFVFDYLNDNKQMDVINDKNLIKKIENFIKNNLTLIDNLIIPERKILGPYLYNRAELISIGVLLSNENTSTLNDALEIFCTNESLIRKTTNVFFFLRN